MPCAVSDLVQALRGGWGPHLILWVRKLGLRRGGAYGSKFLPGSDTIRAGPGCFLALYWCLHLTPNLHPTPFPLFPPGREASAQTSGPGRTWRTSAGTSSQNSPGENSQGSFGTPCSRRLSSKPRGPWGPHGPGTEITQSIQERGTARLLRPGQPLGPSVPLP